MNRMTGVLELRRPYFPEERITAMRVKGLFVAVVGAVLVFVSSCAEVGISGRQQLNFVPDGLMNSMSLQSYNEFISQNELSPDMQQREMVNRVGRRIARAVVAYCREYGMQDTISSYKWEFNLVDSNEVNAWAMPGGKVVVYTGLLPITQNEAGLATVMGHEIAHAFAKHGAERMSHSLIFELGGMALSKAVEEKPEQTRSLLLQAYGVGGQIGVMLPFSRVQESEADRLGLIFMAIAGYDPAEAITFWQRMSQAKKDQANYPEFLSTHPADATRIGDLQRHLDEAQDYGRTFAERFSQTRLAD